MAQIALLTKGHVVKSFLPSYHIFKINIILRENSIHSIYLIMIEAEHETKQKNFLLNTHTLFQTQSRCQGYSAIPGNSSSRQLEAGSKIYDIYLHVSYDTAR